MANISETKTPQPGEWWLRNSGGRIFFIVGFDPDGGVVHYNENVGLYTSKTRFFCKEFRHEPRCTGFGWVEPPAIDPNDMPLNPVPGKLVATGTVTFTPVKLTTCVACGVNWALDGSVSCRECYEHAIEATGCPVESPDDWVTQDRAPARPGIDQRKYNNCGNWEDARAICWGHIPAMHGTDINGVTLRLRCRRKDLPGEVTSTPEKITADTDNMAAIITEHTQQVRELTQRIGELVQQVNERDAMIEQIRRTCELCDLN